MHTLGFRSKYKVLGSDQLCDFLFHLTSSGTKAYYEDKGLIHIVSWVYFSSDYMTCLPGFGKAIKVQWL